MNSCFLIVRFEKQLFLYFVHKNVNVFSMG